MPGARHNFGRGFPNGDQYDGETIEGNINDGKCGFFETTGGAKYVGAQLLGKPHGKGKYIVPGAMGYIYEGDFVNGERSGNGVCTFSNGRKYEGDWLGDKMHGNGTLYGAEGVDDFVEYVGPFVEGERSGADGRCRYVNDNIYKGLWLHDKRNGRGELVLGRASSTPGYTPRMGEPHIVAYKGKFENDAPSGMGEFLYSDGSSYVGECVGFSRHGEGLHRKLNGDTYKGGFQLDRRWGKGVLQNKYGEYNGEWQDDLLEGHLIFRGDAAGAVATDLIFYEGPCVSGEMVGNEVVAKYRDGSSYKGAMVAGKPNGIGILEKKRIKIPGVGEFMLRYEGDFMGGVPKGSGTGTLTLLTADPRTAPSPPISAEVRCFIPQLDVSGQYKGMWLNGLPNGDGDWQWVNEQSYRGAVKSGIPQGSGVFITPKVHYEGSFICGLPEGYGKITWRGTEEKKEDTYEGSWKEGYLDGEGKLILHDGSTYTGGWKSGIKEGNGVDSVVKKYHYSGELKEGKRHGKGTISMLKEGFKYEGEFVMDELTGNGTMTLEDGTVIIGGFANGKPHGNVKITLPTQDGFQGEFKHGVVSGSGTLFYNGGKYEGEVADSGNPLPMRHGRGVYTFIEGDVLECTWKRNVLHGDGIYTTSTGDRSTRSYVDGVLKAVSPQSTDAPPSQKGFPIELSEEEQQQQQQLHKKQVVSIRRSLPNRSPSNSFQRSLARQMSSSGTTRSTVAMPKVKSSSISIMTTPKPVSPRSAAVASPSFSFKSVLRISESPVKPLSAMTIVRRRTVTGVAGNGIEAGGSSHLTPFSRFHDGIKGLPSCTESSEEWKGAQLNTSYPVAGGDKGLVQSTVVRREAREGEIHSLTEALRRINEQIWQESFMAGLPVTAGNEGLKLTKASRLDQLESLQLERRNIVDKLSVILR
ncbi:MORN Repeat Containing 1 protein [Trypanosoma cruzi]|nr:MORN Repeat Containing 1 protein [Trypanosoma cruzi]